MFGPYPPRTWSAQSHVLASSEALGPSSHSPPRGRPFSLLTGLRARTALDMASVLLDVAELACRRGGRPVFDHLSFALGAGELLALVGRNGSGKTTLLRALALLVPSIAGTVLWQGVGVQADPDAWRGRLAWLGHLDGLKGDLTVRENLLT